MKRRPKRIAKSAARKKRLNPFPNYEVPIVRPSEITLRNDFWDGKPETKRMKKAISEGSLSRTVWVWAKTKEDAAKQAEADNPGWKAILSEIRRRYR